MHPTPCSARLPAHSTASLELPPSPDQISKPQHPGSAARA